LTRSDKGLCQGDLSISPNSRVFFRFFIKRKGYAFLVERHSQREARNAGTWIQCYLIGRSMKTGCKCTGNGDMEVVDGASSHDSVC